MPEFDPNPTLPAQPVYQTNTMDVDRMLRTSQGDVKDLSRDTRPPVANEQTGADVFAASFRTGTSVGALSSSNFLRELLSPTEDSPALTAAEAYDRAVREGLGRYASKIAPWASTEAMYQAMAEDARRDEADHMTVAASGKMGHVIGFAANLAEPFNYVPVAGALARIAKAGTLAHTALTAAEAGLVSTAASEAIQQSVSSTKTLGESTLNVATGTLFSAVLGGSLHKMIGAPAAAKFERTQERAQDGKAMEKEVAANLATTREVQGTKPLKNPEKIPDQITPENIDTHYDAAKARIEAEAPKKTTEVAAPADALVARAANLDKKAGELQTFMELKTRSIAKLDEQHSLLDAIDARLEWLRGGAVGNDPVVGGPKFEKVRDVLDKITGGRQVRIDARIKNLEQKRADILHDHTVVRPQLEADMKSLVAEAHGVAGDKAALKAEGEKAQIKAEAPKGAVDQRFERAAKSAHGGSVEAGGLKIDVEHVGSSIRYSALAPDGETAAFAVFRPNQSTPNAASAFDVFVAPELRRKGIATAIYADAKARLSREGINVVPTGDLTDMGKAMWKGFEKAATGPQSVGAAGTQFQGLNSSSRLDARFLGLPLDSMLKNANKAFTTAPFRGIAGVTATAAEWLGIPAKALRSFADNPAGENFVSQGMRNIRLAAQDSESPAFRSYIQQVDINPWYTKSDKAGLVQHGELNFPDEHRKLYAQWTEAHRNADEIWRKSRGELKNADGSPMDRETYAREVYFANISDGKSDNPHVASAAAGYRKFYAAVEQKLVDAKLLEADKKLRNAETYGTISYLPDAVRNDRENFIRQHAQDFANRFEADYGTALQAKKDNDRVMKAATAALEQQVADKVKALDEGKTKDIAQRRKEHADRLQNHTEAIDGHRSVLAADKSDEIRALDINFERKREQVAAKRDTELQAAQDRADARGSKDAALGDMSDHSARKIEESAQAKSNFKLKQEQARAEKAYDAEIKRLDPNSKKSEYTIERNKIDRYYDAEEARLSTEDTRKKKDLKQRLDDEIKAEHETHTENVAKEEARVEKERQKFKDKLSEYDTNVLKLNTPEKRAAKAKELGASLYHSVTANPSGILIDSDFGRPFGGLKQVLKGRSTETSQRIQAENGWIDTNIFRAGESYMRKAGTGTAMAQVLKTERKIAVKDRVEGGPDVETVGDMSGQGARRAIIADYDDLIRKAGERGDTAVEKALTTKKVQAVTDFDAFHDMVLGNHGGGDSSINLGKVGPAIQHYNNWRFMGGTVIASLTDPANAIAAHGFADSMKYGFIPAAKNFKAAWANVAAEDLPDMYRILQMTGASVEHVVNARLAAATDLGNPAHSKMLAGADMLSKQFWRISGLAGWTTLMKDIGGTITHGRLINAAQRGWENLSLGERTWLTNLKIGEADLARVGKMHEEQAAAGHGTSAGVPYGRTQDLSVEGRGDYKGWSDREIADKFDNAVYRESFNVAVTPTPGDKLALTATPIGRMIWQYRNFGVSMSARVMGRNAALAGIDDASRMNFYSGVTSMIALAGLVDFLKVMTGEATGTGSKNHADMSAADVWAKKWQTDPGAQMYHVLDRSAVLWPVTEASNVLKTMGLPNIEQGIGKLTGDKSLENPGRFGHRGVVEAALGPSAGLLSDVPGAFKDVTGGVGYALGLNPDWQYHKSDFQRDRRLTPLQNTIPFQQGINYGHKYLGTIWNWPEPR